MKTLIAAIVLAATMAGCSGGQPASGGPVAGAKTTAAPGSNEMQQALTGKIEGKRK
jgi:hypothetical protein